MKEFIADIDGKEETYALSIHLDYKYLKYSDLDWLMKKISRAAEEIRQQQLKKHEAQGVPNKRLHIIVESVSTKQSIDIGIVLVAVTYSMTIVSWGVGIYLLYDYLKKESEDMRYVGRRENLDRVRIKRSKRTLKNGTWMIEETGEEFDFKFRSGGDNP